MRAVWNIPAVSPVGLVVRTTLGHAGACVWTSCVADAAPRGRASRCSSESPGGHTLMNLEFSGKVKIPKSQYPEFPKVTFLKKLRFFLDLKFSKIFHWKLYENEKNWDKKIEFFRSKKFQNFSLKIVWKRKFWDRKKSKFFDLKIFHFHTIFNENCRWFFWEFSISKISEVDFKML